jgi:hypothetical protein
VHAAGAAIDQAIGLDPDRRDVLGTDMSRRIDPHRGDAGGAKVVFREEFVSCWLAHDPGKQWLIWLRDVKSPTDSKRGSRGRRVRARRWLEATTEHARSMKRRIACSCAKPSQASSRSNPQERHQA